MPSGGDLEGLDQFAPATLLIGLATRRGSAHTGRMEMSHLIRVRTSVIGDGHATTLWVTAKGTEAEALEAVRQRVSATSEVSIAEHAVSSETMVRIGLGSGQIWHL